MQSQFLLLLLSNQDLPWEATSLPDLGPRATVRSNRNKGQKVEPSKMCVLARACACLLFYITRPHHGAIASQSEVSRQGAGHDVVLTSTTSFCTHFALLAYS